MRAPPPAGGLSAWCWRSGLLVVGKSEFGVCGVVGGMMVIELLAGTMRRRRGRIAAVEDDMRQTYTVKHIRKGLTLLSSKDYPEVRNIPIAVISIPQMMCLLDEVKSVNDFHRIVSSLPHIDIGSFDFYMALDFQLQALYG